MPEQGLSHKLIIIISIVLVVPSLVLCYIFYEQQITFTSYHLVLFVLILALVLFGVILLRYVFEAFSTAAGSLKKATESGEKLSTDLQQEMAELNEISFSFNRLMDRLEETTESMNQRVLELNSIREITEFASRIMNMEELLQLLLDKAMIVTSALIGSIFVVDPAHGRFRMIAAKGFKSVEENYFADINESLMRVVVSEKKPLLVQDIENDPRTRKTHDARYGSPSFLSMPILRGLDLTAVLNLARKKNDHLFDVDDERILSIMLGEIGFALENAHLHTSIEAHSKELEERNILLEEEITDRKRIEEALRSAEELYRTLAERSFAGVYVLQGGKFRFMNSNVINYTGYTREELFAQEADQLVHPEDRAKVWENAKAMLLGERTSPYEFRIITKLGETRWIMGTATSILYEGKPAILWVSMDFTERKRMEEEIITLSVTDQLTGLYNRRGFINLAKQQLKIAERTQKGLLFLFADIDDMKGINDHFGHLKGDEALAEAAYVLKEVFRESDILARVGGDEFSVLTVGSSVENSEVLKDRLQYQIDQHNSRENRDYHLSMSIGLVYSDPESHSSIDELMSRADALMYEQKRSKHQ